MRVVRRIPSVVAIYAIAIHTILWGVGTLGATPTIDPASVICHAAPAGSPGQPSIPDQTPSHACDHCNLCSAIAPPAELDDVLVEKLAPARLLHVLRPASSAVRISLAATAKLARGPPAFA